MSKVAIITNIPAPYRVDLYYYLQTHVKEHEFFIIYTSRNEDNRAWNIQEEKLLNTRILESRILKIKNKLDTRYIHLPGNIGKELNSIQPDIVAAEEYNPSALQSMWWAKLHGKKLPINVAFVLSDGEELGLRGIRPAAFRVNPQEAIAIDVSFGDGIGISENECGKLGKGGMIGISPALSKEISNKLKLIAKENDIPYQLEVMGAKTGTNADMIAVNREGVKTCTLSIPLRNMHSDNEILSLSDLESVCDLLYEYIMAGGCFNG